ncbi:putative lipoprotein [Bacteroides fragilis str. S38L5]|nr:putative lipoprotein [Bacteroides fragilis str. S38L5]EYB13844.1 putative lipoprotein [Bacteroides fragilis str. S38L3]
MKTDILKALRRLRLPALALAAFLASCTSELAHEPAPGGGSQAGEALVTLRLQVPGAAAAGRTRAVGDNAERTVNDLYILAFKVDGGVETFDYYAVARKGTEDLTTGVSKWTASLRPKDYEQTFVMIANAQGTPGDVNTQIAALVDDGAGGTSVGEDKETVLEKLTDKLTADEQTAGFNAKGDNDHHPFTMYGQTAATKIELGKDVSLTVALHRIVARVNVAFTGDAQAYFTAEKVYLCNFTDRARVIPNGLGQTTGADYEPAATIPADAQKLPAAFDALGNIPTYTVTANEVKNQIYLFETNQPAPDDADAHLKRPCLVVQGTYEGYEGYYRVDFATQDAATGDVTYRDIIRNHSYNFTVTNVSGRGSATLKEAMETKASNLTADMILWDDNVIGNIDFEGDRVLGISTNRYELIKSGGTKLLQVRATKNVTWTANIYAANADGSADVNGARPAWIYFTNEGGTDNNGTTLADQTGIDALQDIYFKVNVNEGTDAAAERKAIIRLTDEKNRLSVEAVVTQNQVEIPVYLRVKIDGETASEVEFGHDHTLTRTASIEFGGPNDVTLSWEITVDEGGKGIDIEKAEVNGTSHIPPADLKGEIQPTAENNSAIIVPTVKTFNTGEAYGTLRGRLMLIATSQSTGETEVLDIPLVQKKYGLKVNKTEVLCGGQEVLIYVKGNYEWQAEIRNDDPGYVNASNDGLVFDFANGQQGTPSEDLYIKESVVRIRTKATPKKQQVVAPEQYKTNLIFKERKSQTPYFNIDINFKPGILAVAEKLYEVYGPVDIAYETKDQNNPTYPDAKIMTYEQGCALSTATGEYDNKQFSWQMCKNSVLKKEFVIAQNGKDLHSSDWDTNTEARLDAKASGFVISERVCMTYSEGDSYKQFDRQHLLSVNNKSTGERHDYFMVTIKKTAAEQAQYNISAVGYLRQNQWGYYDIFTPKVNNPTWVVKSGDTTYNLPIELYGIKMSNILKPTFRFEGNNWAQENYEVHIDRAGITSPYALDDYKTNQYPTYYFKETQETIID